MGESKTNWEMNIEQKFQQITGTISVNGAAAVLKEAEIKVDKIKLTAERQVNGKTLSFVFEGVVSGDTIVGKAIQNGKELGEWKASRNPATVKPIDPGTDTDYRY
jgi:hypothetical protein